MGGCGIVGVNINYPEGVMELGEKIRQARLDAGLSQRQLCGDTITRNMLSLIESGRARPSMDTLGYLAARLGKSVSYFLEEQAVTSPNQQIMDNARGFYARREFRQALEMLESYRIPDGVFDPERYLLEALCCFSLAEQALAEGKNAYARSLLERAAVGEKSPYYHAALERQRCLLLYRAAPEKAGELAQRLPELTGELLLRGKAALDAGDAKACAGLLDAAQQRTEEWFFLRGKAAMQMGDFAGAATFLHRAEARFGCFSLLERCYRELEDYKMAYEYACKGRAMDN